MACHRSRVWLRGRFMGCMKVTPFLILDLLLWVVSLRDCRPEHCDGTCAGRAAHVQLIAQASE